MQIRSDANYLLRAQNRSDNYNKWIFFKTTDACQLQLNKTYHVADGIRWQFLKLLSKWVFNQSGRGHQVNLIQNNWITQIGFYQFAFYKRKFHRLHQ